MKIPYNEYRYLSEEQYLDLISKIQNSNPSTPSEPSSEELQQLRAALNKEIADRIADVNDARAKDKVVKSAEYNSSTNTLILTIANDTNPVSIDMTKLLQDADILSSISITRDALLAAVDNSTLVPNKYYTITKTKYKIHIKALSNNELSGVVKLTAIDAEVKKLNIHLATEVCYDIKNDSIYKYTDSTNTTFFNLQRTSAIDLDNVYAWYSDVYNNALSTNTIYTFYTANGVAITSTKAYITNSKFTSWGSITLDVACTSNNTDSFIHIDEVHAYTNRGDLDITYKSFKSLQLTTIETCNNKLIWTDSNNYGVFNVGNTIKIHSGTGEVAEIVLSNCALTDTVISMDIGTTAGYHVTFNNLLSATSFINLYTEHSDMNLYSTGRLLRCHVRVTENSVPKYFSNTNSDTYISNIYTGEIYGVFVSSKGTSTQFLKGDGTLDSTTYATTDNIPTKLSQLTDDKVVNAATKATNDSDNNPINTTYVKVGTYNTKVSALEAKDTELQTSISNTQTQTLLRVDALSQELNGKVNTSDNVWLTASDYSALSTVDSAKTYYITEI